MTRLIYNLLFAVFFTLSTPVSFLKLWRRGHWRQGFGERFGRYSAKVKQSVTNSHVLWIHAVSVGESNVAIQLIRALEPRVPNAKIIVSTTTTTGMRELRRKLPGHIGKVYYPVDFRGVVSRAMRTLHPEAIILIEAEIWPNFLWRARDGRIPVFLVNARMSERSRRRYALFGFVFRPIFASLAGVGAQNPEDARRLIRLGCAPENVHTVGQLKFDAARVEARPLVEARSLLEQLGVEANAPILVGGSTHAGEERILAEIAGRLRARFPNLFLVLVPRHQERGREVGRELSAAGVRFAYRTEIGRETRFAPGGIHCLLVNTTGELKYFYEIATAIFVGKSLTAEGGQNPIEPAALGKPVLFGPNMQNFADIAKQFVERQAAWRVADAAELEAALAELLASPGRREEFGRRAIEVVRDNAGAVERTVEMILRKLPEDLYVAGHPAG